MEIDEQIIYDLSGSDDQAVWGLLLASGYLKVRNYEAYVSEFGEWKQDYELQLTNFEVRSMFRNMIRRWFATVRSDHNGFIQALLLDNVEEMNIYMNRIALQTFSYFDTGCSPSWELPERFNHGFVPGMMVELSDRYILTSNRESGLGGYDVMLEPKNRSDNAIILELKIRFNEKIV